MPDSEVGSDRLATIDRRRQRSTARGVPASPYPRCRGLLRHLRVDGVLHRWSVAGEPLRRRPRPPPVPRGPRAPTARVGHDRERHRRDHRSRGTVADEL